MNLPQAFISEIQSYGAECLDGLIDALSSSAPEVSIRINRAKTAASPADAQQIKWCDTGFHLSRRPQFTFDPALHQGLYYVQDASSMAITHVIRHLCDIEGNRPLKYLDACAAPGGKTTAAISALPDGSLVVANEYDYRRAAILAENLAKWGSPSIMVTRGDTSRFSRLDGCFDIIAADVPCSGEGMMRKDSEAVAQWTPQLVDECVSRQREIISNLWNALRPGGYLIYSTCTFNRHENEEMVDFICNTLGGETIDTHLNDFEGVAGAIDSPHHCSRFVPGRIRGEGLFMAVIRRHGDSATAMVRPAKKPMTQFAKPTSEFVKALDWLTGSFEPVMTGDRLLALPQDHAKWMRAAASWLDVISAGVAVATVKGRDVIPSQELALSSAFAPGAFPSAEVDYSSAIAYLRREAVTIDAPRGFVLLTYRGTPLGFVKNLGNRANNLYPAPWRIMSANTPDNAPEVLG